MGNRAPNRADKRGFVVGQSGHLVPAAAEAGAGGSIESEWGASENNRRARYYKLTRSGRRQLQNDVEEWQQTAEIMARFLAARVEDLS